jgi:hypothetical protein
MGERISEDEGEVDDDDDEESFLTGDFIFNVNLY